MLLFLLQSGLTDFHSMKAELWSQVEISLGNREILDRTGTIKANSTS